MKFETEAHVEYNQEECPDVLERYNATLLLLCSPSITEEAHVELDKFDEWLAKQPVGKKFKITIEEVE